ncbi:GntR family transcriptional regulator [Streptomyces abikoensis]|uniref:GntR family transcriptional regulator n=1 Tax=Streptomyces abikoensis TaxID=97398 RepID=UPI0016746AE8|nr:GntR family transcriptional regulator [Streptomyces abikoensis]GGP72479.1 hypothetical protein GCM10010214_54370 [Streptomyces abikoensis]
MANAYTYEIVADALRHQIETGKLKEGARLPSEAALADEHSVSVPTLREALRLLEADGLVEKQQGKGNYVSQTRPRITYVRGRQSRSPSTEKALKVHVRAGEVDATRPIAELLGVSEGTALAQYVYLSFQDAKPQVLTRVYVPQAVARHMSPETDPSPWGDHIQAGLSAAGVQVAATAERLVARLPRSEEAELLRIARKAPVTAIERTLLDGMNRVVAVALLTLRGDSTEAVFIDESPVEVPSDSPLRRLPWNTPDGSPCFLSPADAVNGPVARIADALEANQVKTAIEVLAGIRAILDNPRSDFPTFTFALRRAAESLEEMLRIAEGRGAPMPPTDSDEPSGGTDRADGEETDKAHQ